MANAWRRFVAAFAMELRLHCFHWAYPGLHVAWAVLLWLMHRHLDQGSARAALEGSVGRTAVGLVSLIALFVAGAAASRSERVRFATLEQSLPTGFEVVLGRWLATLAALMGAMIEPLVYAWWQGPTGSWLEALPIFVVEAAITLGVVAAFAWWLVSRMGMRRWLYPVMAAGWLAVAFGSNPLSRDGTKLPAVFLLDFTRIWDGTYGEVWGRLLAERSLWFNLFYLGLMGLLLALVARRVQSVRLHRRSMASTVMAVAALALALVAANRYVAQYTKWGAIADKAQQSAAKADSVHAQPDQDVTVIDRYDLTADFRTPADPRYTARLVVRNSSKEPVAALNLTLHHQLAVTAVSLPYDRDGDFLSLKPSEPLAAGQSTTVEIIYSGPLLSLRRRSDTSPFPTFFTMTEGVRLAEQAGWYPRAGRRLLLPAQTGDGGSPAAAFRLQVQVPDGWGVVTNLPQAEAGLYEAKQAVWAGIMASPRMKVERTGSLTLATARNDWAAVSGVAPDYEKALMHMARFFPSVKVDGLTIAALDGASGFPDSTLPADGQAIVWPTRWRLLMATDRPELGDWYIGDQVLRNLWLMSGGAARDMEGPLFNDLRLFLWNHYQYDGDAIHVAAGRVGQILRDVEVTHGEAGIARAIRQIQAHPEVVNLSPPDFETWIKEAAGHEQ